MRNVRGEFSAGSSIKGNTSNAIWSLTSSNIQDDAASDYDDNFRIETEADNILDFSETNPFGEP